MLRIKSKTSENFIEYMMGIRKTYNDYSKRITN